MSEIDKLSSLIATYYGSMNGTATELAEFLIKHGYVHEWLLDDTVDKITVFKDGDYDTMSKELWAAGRIKELREHCDGKDAELDDCYALIAKLRAEIRDLTDARAKKV